MNRVESGDLNGDGVVDLEDAVLALQIISGQVPSETIYPAADVNGDGKVGMAEVVYTLFLLSSAP